uniref:Peptidase inhibitor 15-A n=1 Tax=Schistocephalus solidus TaxID=70667 RepID=A0A0X3PZ32_SCHSO
MVEQQFKLCCHIVATVGLISILTVSALTPEQRKLFLDYHNDVRQKVSPPASNMQHMIYNESLEVLAQKWVDKCEFRHPPRSDEEYRPYGQNIGASGNPREQGSIEAILKKWHQEVHNYNYTHNSCNGVCGHYTQMVWHNSYQLGCAMAKCSGMLQGMNAFFIACQYYPRGNWKGQRPYSTADVTPTTGKLPAKRSTGMAND